MLVFVLVYETRFHSVQIWRTRCVCFCAALDAYGVDTRVISSYGNKQSYEDMNHQGTT